jgi:hypothetical protein
MPLWYYKPEVMKILAQDSLSFVLVDLKPTSIVPAWKRHRSPGRAKFKRNAGRSTPKS